MPLAPRSFHIPDSHPPDSQWRQSLHRRLERWLPNFAIACIQLARWDRPIGFLLLMWPCWWAIALAAKPQTFSWATAELFTLFALGAIAMRGAGCTWNDILDRNIDAKVARTQSRPLPSGRISLGGAWLFLLAQSLIGAAILLRLPSLAVIIAIAGLLPVAVYPIMKRITYWPQLFLGITFNWGILVAWAAIANMIPLAALILYAGAIAWTVGYDTIYAQQDREDDQASGIYSTALLFATQTRNAVILCYAIMIALFSVVGWLLNASWLYYLFLAAVTLHLMIHILRVNLDDPQSCLRCFRSHHLTALIFFIGIVAGV